MTFSPDCEFIATLPDGYDERATLALAPGNVIVLAHPDLPPLVLNEQTREFEAVPNASNEGTPLAAVPLDYSINVLGTGPERKDDA